MATTTSSISSKDFRSPTTGSRGRKLAAEAMALRYPLAVNANGTQSDVGDHDGDISAITLSNSAVGSGMTVDVLINGTSALAGGVPFTHSAAYPAKSLVNIPFAANKRILMGDKVDVVRASFTAGASVVTIKYL